VKKPLLLLALAGFMISCSQTENKQNMNPFFEAYNTPFDVPPFDERTLSACIRRRHEATQY